MEQLGAEHESDAAQARQRARVQSPAELVNLLSRDEVSSLVSAAEVGLE